MARSYEFLFVCADDGDVRRIVGHGNVRKTAERSARRRLRDLGKAETRYRMRSCTPVKADP